MNMSMPGMHRALYRCEASSLLKPLISSSSLQDDADAGVGFTIHYNGSKTWYFKRLVWTNSPENHQWTPTEWQWELYDRDRGKHSELHGDGVKTLGNAVHDFPPVSCISSSGAHIPAEILLCIVEYVPGCAQVVKANVCLASLEEIHVEHSGSGTFPERIDPWASGHWENVAGIALACREWFERYAPLVFSKVYVDEPRIEEFCECIRLPNSPIRAYARSLVLRDRHPWEMAARLSAMLPGVSIIGCSTFYRHDSHTPKAPTSLSAIQDAGITAAALRILSLNNIPFGPVADFVRLVCSFPSLSILALEAVYFDPSSPSTSGSTATPNLTVAGSLGHIGPSTIVLRQPIQDTIPKPVATYNLLARITAGN